MGIGGIGDVGRQRRVTPEIDHVENGLNRKQQVEQDERTQHRCHTEEIDRI